jgi:hypothetical protein
VTGPHSISATFAIHTFTITPSAAPNGFISPSSPQTVPYGGSQSFTITPANGYHVANVIVDGASIGPVTSHTFTSVTGPHSISATFAINTYTITPSAGPNGFISPPTPQTVEYGQKQAFTIRAAAGYYVEDVVVDGASVGPVTTYTFTGVNASHTISASFAPGVQTGLWISTTKTVVNYGGSALLQGELYDASDQLAPVGLGGRPVTFEYSSSPTGPWASLGTHLTSSVAGALGKVSVTISPQAPTYYRLRYYKEASLEYGGAVSEVRKVGVRPSLGRPVAPTSARVGRWFTVYGSLKPHFAAGQKTVEIKVYRYRNGRWVKVKTQWATNVDSRDFTKYRLRTRLTTKAKYRFRATSTAAGWVAVTTSYSKTLVVR